MQITTSSLIEDMIVSLEKELSDTKRVLSLLNETKMNLETKIERLYVLRSQQSDQK